MKQFREEHGGGPRTLAQEDSILKEKARSNAKSLAYSNLPTSTDASAEGYFKSIRAGYDTLLTREMKKIPANADFVADLEMKASEQKGTLYQEKLNDARKQLHKANLEMSEADGDDGRHINSIPIWLGIFVIAFGEAFLTYKAVGSLLDVGNNLVLLIILMAFSVLFVCIPKALKWYFEEYCADKKLKGLLYLIPIIMLGGGYYCLGYLRSHFMAMQPAMDVNGDSTNTSSFIASPYVFVALNFLFLMGSYYLASMLPTRQQDKIKNDLLKRERSITKLESEVERYEGLVGQMPDQGKNSLIRASTSNASRKETYSQINSMFLQACGSFIDTNLQYRTDGIRPQCFDLTIEDLKDNSNQ